MIEKIGCDLLILREGARHHNATLARKPFFKPRSYRVIMECFADGLFENVGDHPAGVSLRDGLRAPLCGEFFQFECHFHGAGAVGEFGCALESLAIRSTEGCEEEWRAGFA